MAISSSWASWPTRPRGAFASIDRRSASSARVGKLGMRDETGQDAVEQIDVIGAEARRTLQEKLADAARGIGAALGVATTDDFVEFRDQRW